MFCKYTQKNFGLFATHFFTNFKVKRLKTKIIQQVLPKKCSIISQMISISTLKEPLKCEGRCLCISNICLFSQLKVSKSQMLSSLSSRVQKECSFPLKFKSWCDTNFVHCFANENQRFWDLATFTSQHFGKNVLSLLSFIVSFCINWFWQ